MLKPEAFEQLSDARRRDYLRQLLYTGALGALPCHLAYAGWFSSSSKKLADDRSIHSLEGDVRVNEKPANLETRIYAGDTISTGDSGEIKFAVGGDSFLLRSRSEMEIAGDNFFVQSLKMITGRLLSVFATREQAYGVEIATSTATIGIRGTGVYLESEPDQTYACTCYGKVTLGSNQDPNDIEKIKSKNHDEPRYITRDSSKGSRIRKAPVINHSNKELELLEAIVGRKVPPGFGKQSYEN
ncbi:MAG: hypothetical protein AAF353_17980 [Pseudomonadota bacterium]